MIYYQSVKAMVSEEDAYCAPKSPAVNKIWDDVEGRKSFDCLRL